MPPKSQQKSPQKSPQKNNPAPNNIKFREDIQNDVQIPEGVSHHDFNAHELRLLRLEKTSSVALSSLGALQEMRADIRELRSYILGLYVVIGAFVLGRVVGII